MKVLWILYIVFTVLEILGTYSAINEMFFEYDLPTLTCYGGLQGNGKVEILAPTGETLRYENLDLCAADQTYTFALIFVIAFSISALKIWLCVVLYYY